VISETARRIETRLARALRVDPSEVRDYVTEVLEDRLWRGGEKRERRTGFRFVRGTHGGTYVRDPDGTDVLPPNVEPPPERQHPLVR
jgi:hypothetical protein